jgi:hypothetical protein
MVVRGSDKCRWMPVLLLVYARVADGHVYFGDRDGRGSGEYQGE